MIESVTVRQRGAYDFDTHYENLCALQSSCPIPAVKAHLGESVIDINGDKIRVTDWLPILNTLRINKTLDFVAVRSYYQQNLEEDERKSSAQQRRKIPAIRSKEITYRLCRALKECLSSTPTLSCIELQGIPLRERDLGSLAKGLMKNNTVQHLSLEHSPIGDDGLDMISKGFKNSPSMSSVNFTGCRLTWKGADTMAKIVKHQAMKRHNEAWQDSLRYRRPDLDRMSGLRRMTLNCNPMVGDQGGVVLAEALKDDLWLKALDMQQCGLTDSGSKALLEAIKLNTTIVVLDIRQNPMIADKKIIENIMEHVMINSNGQDTEYKWIKAEPIQDQGKIKAKKKKTRTLQSNFGKKTTIRVSSGSNLARRRSRSTGSVTRIMSPFSSELVRPSPGMPWRTAARAHRSGGYPPDNHTPGKASVFENMSSGSSPTLSPKHEYSTADETTEDVSHMNDYSDVEYQNSKKVRVELEQLKRRLKEETEARAKAEERVLELMVENTRLRQDVEAGRGKSSILDDDQVLESIEKSFQQFHAFLDLLRDAGLGQLITMAGLDEADMSIPHADPDRRRKPAPKPSSGYSHISVEPPTIDTHSAFRSSQQPVMTSSVIDMGPAVHPNVLPDNFYLQQDPTMLQGESLDGSQPKSRFDELYERVLRDTEDALQQARIDAVHQPPRKADKGLIIGGSGETRKERSKERKGKGRSSNLAESDAHIATKPVDNNSNEKSQSQDENSNRSKRSSHSHRSQPSYKEASAKSDRHSRSEHHSGSANKAEPPKPTPRESKMNAPSDKTPPKTNGIQNGPTIDDFQQVSVNYDNEENVHYTESFENSQSDITEDIEEILDDSPRKHDSDEEDF